MYIIKMRPEYLNRRNKIEEWENIDEEDLGDFDQKHMSNHGMNRNLKRDIPLFYDNLKVVQRRLLYVMAKSGLFPPKKDNPESTKGMVKAATIVGDTLKIHPHGDESTWKALVYLRQPWRHLMPLVNVQGNYGNAGDATAHSQMRYVSCGLSKFAQDCFFDEEEWDDLNSSLVDMKPTFDGSSKEPLYLPAKYPLFLLGWGSGTGLGLATSSPGFLPQDALPVVSKLIDDPDAKFVLYPDDPLGCTILDKSVFKKFVDYKPKNKHDKNLTFRVRANYHLDKKGHIVIENTPFEINPISIRKRIRDLVTDGKFDGIADIEIDLEAGKIPQLAEEGDIATMWLEVKPGFDPHILMEKLYKVTDLEHTFALNCVYALMDKTVKFNLRDSILEWINFRRRVLKRMYRMKINTNAKRAYVLDALMSITDKNLIDKVIQIIKNNKFADAVEKIIQLCDVSDYQAREIADMKIKELSDEKYEEFKAERAKCLKKNMEYQEILKSKKNIDEVIKRQMQEGVERYSRPRLSKVIDLTEDKAVNTLHTISITDSGFVKKLAEGMVTNGGIQDDSKLVYLQHNVSNLSKLFMFTPNGRVYSEFVNNISTSSDQGIGMSMKRKSRNDNLILNSAIADVESTKANVIFVTRNGGVKQSKLDAYFGTSQGGHAIKLMGNDSVVEVIRSTNDKDRLLIYTKNGLCSIINVKDITVTSRATVGVTGIRFDEGDEVVGACLVTNSDTHIITVSDKGEVKRFSLETSLTDMRRGSMGVEIMAKSEILSTVFTMNSKTESIKYLSGSEQLELRIEDIPVRTRLSNGGKLINALRGDRLVRIID